MRKKFSDSLLPFPPLPSSSLPPIILHKPWFLICFRVNGYLCIRVSCVCLFVLACSSFALVQSCPSRMRTTQKKLPNSL